MMRQYHADGTMPADRGAIFVFGSNLAGYHGGGAAKAARETFGARMNIGVGLTGRAYAIPTKDQHIETMPLVNIKLYVEQFITMAKLMPQATFFVTRIGCGLAGYSDADIAPMFVGVPFNCDMPEQWRPYLEE